jgi:hypothetical protein
MYRVYTELRSQNHTVYVAMWVYVSWEDEIFFQYYVYPHSNLNSVVLGSQFHINCAHILFYCCVQPDSDVAGRNM